MSINLKKIIKNNNFWTLILKYIIIYLFINNFIYLFIENYLLIIFDSYIIIYLNNLLIRIIIYILKYIGLIIPILLAVAMTTLLERKILAGMQWRKGPNVNGFFGLLQPFADGLKLLMKETIIPIVSNKFLFIIAPIITFILSTLLWLIMPINRNFVIMDLDIGMLFVMAILSLNIYGIIIAGWSSNSRYAFSGGLRAAAQMISYELTLGLILMSVYVAVGSLNLSEIVIHQQESCWFIITYPGLFILFIICMVAETNRPPFDLPEAEAELVAGYNVEYSAVGFALFFIGEYMNIIFMSALCVILFLGGWTLFGLENLLNTGFGAIIFSFKTCCVIVLMIWVRATFPRYRYDQLMYLGWKIYLPISFVYLCFNISIFYLFDALPISLM